MGWDPSPHRWRGFFFCIYLEAVARIVGIDFGERRVGIASTDVLGIAVHGRGTFTPDSAVAYIDKLVGEEEVEQIVVGMPSKPSEAFKKALKKFIHNVEKIGGAPEISFHNEDFTSADAVNVMRQMGLRKKKRQEKGRLDELSAVILLQDYLGHRY